MSKILDTLKDTYYKSVDTAKDTYYKSVDTVKDTYYKSVDNIKTEYNNIISKYTTKLISLYFDVGICILRLSNESPEYKALIDKYSSFISSRENSQCISYFQSQLPQETVQNLLLGKITPDIITKILDILSSDKGKELCSNIRDDPMFSNNNKEYFKAVTTLNNYFPKDIFEQYFSILSDPANRNCIEYIQTKLSQSTINQLLIGNITLDILSEILTVLSNSDSNQKCTNIKNNPIFSKEAIDVFNDIISSIKNVLPNNELSSNDILYSSYIISIFLNKLFPDKNIPAITEMPDNLIELIQQNKQQIIDILSTFLNNYYTYFYGIYEKNKDIILSYAVLIPISTIDYLINFLTDIGTKETITSESFIYGFSSKIISIYTTEPDFYNNKMNDIIKQINQLITNLTVSNNILIIFIIKNNSELFLNILQQIPQVYINYVIIILNYIKNIIKNSKNILYISTGSTGSTDDTVIIQNNIKKYSDTENLDKKCKLIGETYKIYTKIKSIKSIIKSKFNDYVVDAIHIDPNNFSLEQIQQLGRAKQSYDSSIVSSGQFNNIMSYNPQSNTLYYSMIQSGDVPNDYKTNTGWHVNTNTTSYYLNLKTNQHDISCNVLSMGAMTPDQKNVFLTNIDSNIKKNNDIKEIGDLNKFCNKRELVKNKLLADKIQEHGNLHDKATSGYLEIKTDYNIQIINIFNFSLGITLMLGAIYSYRF